MLLKTVLKEAYKSKNYIVEGQEEKYKAKYSNKTKYPSEADVKKMMEEPPKKDTRQLASTMSSQERIRQRR